MKRYPWKQFTTSRANPLRGWTRDRQNTLRRFGCATGCQDCDEDARRFKALWRLVERKWWSCPKKRWPTWLLVRVAEAAGISLERKAGGR